VAELTSIGGLTSRRSFCSPLAVLVVDDVEVPRLLVSLILGEIGSTPAHDAAIPDSPDA
jgi:hypothetical protein